MRLCVENGRTSVARDLDKHKYTAQNVKAPFPRRAELCKCSITATTSLRTSREQEADLEDIATATSQPQGRKAGRGAGFATQARTGCRDDGGRTTVSINDGSSIGGSKDRQRRSAEFGSGHRRQGCQSVGNVPKLRGCSWLLGSFFVLWFVRIRFLGQTQTGSGIVYMVLSIVSRDIEE
ncbi:hypothetical protein LIA77_04776 [Sarocladium implicatum]|nr:hypothetical protein LIA77_04776 [Sarocladium implicatum]